MEKPQKQDNKLRHEWLKPTQFKKGKSGNPGGRPRGSKSMKTYLKERFEVMNDKERLKFLNAVDPDTAWKMAEGNPTNEIIGDLNIKVEKLEEIQKATADILSPSKKT